MNHFGEQSGPNSVGLSLVKTPFLAYLNHGDIWLPDHLEIAIHTLKSGKYKFYMGGTAYSRFIDNTKEQPELVVDEINIENRSPSDPFFRKTSKYEPVSSWILSRMTAEKIGLWNYYTDLYRVPTEDYLLRAWRSKCKFYFSTTVTTWVIVPQSIIDESIKSVNSGNKEHSSILKMLESNSGVEIRNYLTCKFDQWNTKKPEEREKIARSSSITKPPTNSKTHIRLI